VSSLVISGKREALSNWIRKFSTDVFPESGKYGLNESVLGIFKWTKKLTLPKIDYVLIFRHVFAKCENCSVDSFENNIHAYFQVSLVHGRNRRIVVHESKNKQSSLDIGNALSQALHVQLKDNTIKKMPG